MCEFNPILNYPPKIEKVDYIVPERIRRDKYENYG